MLLSITRILFHSTHFFLKQHFYKQYPAEIGKKKQMLSNTLRLNFYYLEIIHILPPRYHTKTIGYILKISQRRSVSVFIRLIIMKMKMKMKNRSYRYDINRPRSKLVPKYIKYKKCLSMMMLKCIKQYLSNI